MKFNEKAGSRRRDPLNRVRNGDETGCERCPSFPLSSTLTHKFLFQWPRSIRGCAVYHPWRAMDQSSLRPSTCSRDSISPPIEINLPAFYNAIATRSDGGWFITTIFQRGNTLGRGRGGDGYGIVRASQKRLWRNSWKTAVSRFNLGRCGTRAKNYSNSWKSSIHFFTLPFYLLRIEESLNLGKVRERGGGIISFCLFHLF